MLSLPRQPRASFYTLGCRVNQSETRVVSEDLLELGYPPGPEYKRIFDEVLERKFTGELKTKAAEMSFVLSHFPKKQWKG